MIPPREEEGMALVTVLLLVLVISIVAIGVLDDIRFGLRRTANAQSVGQGQWYALGAESLAKLRLQSVLTQRPGRVTLAGGWDQPRTFPIENGVIVARLSDQGACFNLNSVVVGPPDAAIASAAGIAQFAALLQVLGTPSGQAQRLSAALADWIDADGDTGQLGAEDEAYARRDPPYRTSDALLSEVSELRAVSGFTPEVYASLHPYVCALPRTGPSQINVNTLSLQGAPVLSAIYRGALPLDAAQRVTAARPAAGWADEGAFFNQPALVLAAQRGVAPPLQQISMTSRYFALDTQVDYGDARVVMNALLEQDNSGAIRTVARRWTPDE